MMSTPSDRFYQCLNIFLFIVGKPVGLCLLRELATITTCHIATQDLARHTREADILVVAVGKAGLIRSDMVKPGAVVIDVGPEPKL